MNTVDSYRAGRRGTWG